jgi:hypothetical protein
LATVSASRILFLIFVAAVPFSLGALACSKVESAAKWDGSVRDSTGVTIVENYGDPLWREGDAWTLREVVRIGRVEGEPEYQFGRITNMTPLSDGMIVVADAMAHKVRFYSPQGVHLRSVGKPGPGPREFGEGTLAVLRSYGDTLLVADYRNMQAHRLAPNGDWLGSFSTRPEGGYRLGNWDSSPSGLVVNILTPLQTPDTPASDTLDVVVVRNLDGSMGDTLGHVPTSRGFRFVGEEPEWRRYAGVPDFDLRWDGGLVTGRSDDYRLVWQDPGGTVETIVELHREPMPFTESDRAVFMSRLESQLEEGNAPPERRTQIKDMLVFEDVYPFYRRFMCGPRGSLWVQQVRPLHRMKREERESFSVWGLVPGEPMWDVFDREGRYLGVVEIPLGMDYILLLDDLVLGVFEDELEVQYVVVMEIDGLPPAEA